MCTVEVLYLARNSRLSIFRSKTLSIEANLTNALSRQNIRVDVPCRFTIAISTEAESMNTAAERLLGLSPEQIQELAKDILLDNCVWLLPR
jgi:uncharacterized membrane protein YqiK